MAPLRCCAGVRMLAAAACAAHRKVAMRLLGLACVCGAAVMLEACYVVPVDLRTAQPAAPIPVAVPVAQTVLTARLYPLNDQANRAGMLNAVIVDNHTGRGTITLTYLGDTLQGEATRLDGPGRRGIANAAGSKGVSAQCDYAITGPAIGAGSCTFSDGAQYRLHFGG
jgi:hypothetical protein